MKRRRREKEQLTPIGASEFALIVNQGGDDAVAVRRALQRFVRTVKRDRKLALSRGLLGEERKNTDELGEGDLSDSESRVSISDSSESDNDGSDDDQNAARTTKRYKKDETWKEDSASYNVPFVGTAVASRGSDPITPGEWPTGLLLAYLQKSPLAIELTGDALLPSSSNSDLHKRLLRQQSSKLKQRKNLKLSQTIHRVYLQALAELTTAAIPVHQLIMATTSTSTTTDDASQNEHQYSSNEEPRFVSELLSKRLPTLLSLLATETNNGKGQSNLPGGCGPLAAHVLQILSRLALVSTRTARHVARSLEQSLPEGVLRFLLTQRRAQQLHQVEPPPKEDNGDGEKPKESLTKISVREKAQVAALQLTTTLAEVDDSVVFSCISTSGVNDRKIRPGMLFMSLQRGLPHHREQIADPSHRLAVAHLLQSIRGLLDRTTLSKRSLSEIFSRECIQNLSQMAAWAPPLSRTTRTFEDVLAATDTYDGDESSRDSGMDQVAVEARRLLFALLGDCDRSPLLQSVVPSTAGLSRGQSSKMVEELVVRPLIQLLDGKDHGFEIRRFVLRIVNAAPSLFSALLRTITLPELKRPFAFVARLNCLSVLLLDGPPAWKSFSFEKEESSIKDEAVKATILPRALNKQTFAKALQSKNHLVALMSLQLYVVVLERCRVFLSDVGSGKKKDLVNRIGEALTRILPDLPALWATLSKLDFGRRSDAVLFGYACEAVRAFRTVFSGHVNATKFDWTKLLPRDAKAFCSAPLFVQKMILSSVEAAISSQETVSAVHISLFENILSVILNTRSSEILRQSRAIAIALICRVSPIENDSREGQISRQYEGSCWVDGITKGAVLDGFCTLLQQSVSVSIPGSVPVARAWRNAGLPTPIPTAHPSTILVQALQLLPQSTTEFALLTLQVLARCLIYDVNPLPLAALILDTGETLDSVSEEFPVFVRIMDYARSLVFFDQYSGEKKLDFAVTMLKACYSDGSYPATLLADSGISSTEKNFGAATDDENVFVLTRQLVHLATVAGAEGHAQILKFLRRMLPVSVSITSREISDPLSLQVRLLIRRCFSQHSFFVECLLQTSGKRFQLSAEESIGRQPTSLYSYFVGPFLSEEMLVASLDSFLSGRFEKNDSPFADEPSTRLLRLYVKLIIQKVDWKTFDKVSAAARLSATILKMWMSLTSEHVSTGLRLEIVQQLEEILCRTLSNGFSSLVLLEYGSDILLRRCLTTKLWLVEHNHRSSNCLMAAVIESDPVRFGPAFLRLHSEEVDNAPYQRVFRLASLDNALCGVFENRDVKELGPKQAIDSLGRLLNGRSHDMLADTEADMVSLDRFFSALLAYTQETSPSESVPLSAHAALLTKLLGEDLRGIASNSERISASFQQKIIVLSLRLCGLRAEGARTLSSTLLVFLCNAIPPSLRGFLKRNGLSDGHLPPLWLIRWLLELLATCRDLDTSVDGTDFVSCLPTLLRASLRYGIGTNGEVDHMVRALCLELVSSLVQFLQRGANHLLQLTSSFSSKPLASYVFEMISSHSKFRLLLISPGSVAVEKVRIEALRLLRCCLLATEEIRFDEDVWNSLLSCFDAGLSEKDRLVRQLLSLLAEKAPTGSNFTSLHQLRWGTVNVQPSSGNWEWLLESIDLRRVYATIDCFPTHDTLCLELDGGTNGFEAEPRNDPVDGVEGKKPRPYSPGFLLPLLLGALEDNADRGSKENNVVRDESEPQGKAPGMMIEQRLCEKGGLALALNSLSSEDAAVRKLSVAILGLLIEAVESTDAHQMVSWRERPQIAMLLNAVQRSLVVRAAEDGTSTLLSVAKLPGFSAVFLARASLLLARPSDNLFQAMNRAFLRTELDGGAFQDLTRLPVFVSLFCSSSNDSEQLKSERRFALDLVKDGFTGEECYKLLMACHCPELLLTSLESIRACSSMQREDEALLLVKTLTRIVSSGGEHAASHLIARLGLLSWLRSLLVGRPVHEIIPTRSSRRELLVLLAEVIMKASDIMSGEELTASTSGLCQPLLSLTIESIDQTHSPPAHTSQNSPLSSITRTCEVLAALQRALSKLNVETGAQESPRCCRSDGYSMSSAVNFLLSINSRKNLESAICSLCYLPVNDDPDESRLFKTFCETVLTSVSEAHGVTQTRSKLIVLQRVRLLSNTIEKSIDERRQILLELLRWWSHCAREQELRKAWHQCFVEVACFCFDEQSSIGISQPTGGHSDDKNLFSFVRSIIQHEQDD